MYRKQYILTNSWIFTTLLIFYIVFGLVLYDLPIFQPVDEIFPFVLLFYSLLSTHKIHKYLVLFLITLSFYIGYSLLIGSNNIRAVLFDSISIAKPFITLFSVLMIRPKLLPEHKMVIRYSVLAVLPFLLFAAINSFGKDPETIKGELLSGARLGFCCIYLALTYFLVSKHTAINLIIAVIIGAIGIACPTSKYLVTMLAAFFVFILTKRHKLRFNIPLIALLVILVTLIVLFTIEEFSMYMTTDAARGAMYFVSGLILIDYFPFGSGLASFGTPASANYYSNIYYEYSLNSVYGLSPSNPDFISDAFYPVLAEFGIIGLILFIAFILFLFKKVKNSRLQDTYRVGMIILASLLIESISDVSLLGNRGEYSMLILGYLISESENHSRHHAEG